MELKALTYLIYVIISLALAFSVGKILHKHGKKFLMDIFKGDETLVDSINMLLLIGFYLVNLGYILFTLITRNKVENWVEVIELLSTKIGSIVIVLGLMHFVNILILFKLRSRAISAAKNSY